FLGQLEEFDREVTRDDRRILDQIRNFLQQRRLRRDQTADAPAEPARVRLELAPNLRLTLAAIEDDEVLEQPRLIIVEHLDLDRPPRAAACRQEAMAVGIRSRANVLHERTLRILVPADHERHDAAAVEKNQPADRPREHEIALAVLEVAVPAHL